jgi:hypothetical protein
MATGGCPTTALTYGSGTGTLADPINIDDSSQLQLLWDSPSDWDDSVFRLTADIDMAATPNFRCSWNRGIGTVADPFGATLLGNGKTIRDLELVINDQGDLDDTGVAGLFGVIGVTGSVTDLDVEDILIDLYSDDTEVYAGAVAGIVYGALDSITATPNFTVDAQGQSTPGVVTVVGGVAGRVLPTGSISQATFTGITSAQGHTSISGGVVGWLESDASELLADAQVQSTAYSGAAIGGGVVGRATGGHDLTDAGLIGQTVTVYGESAIAGGVVGVSDFDVARAWAADTTGAVALSIAAGSQSVAGGIVGDALGGDIADVFTASNVDGSTNGAASDAFVGGIAGRTSASVTISDAGARGTADASATGRPLVGGLVGSNGGQVDASYAAVYADVMWPASDDSLGGFFGYNTGNATRSFWDGYPTAIAAVGPGSGSVAPTDLSTITVTESLTYTTYDDSGWSITDGYGGSANPPTIWSWCVDLNGGYPLNTFLFPGSSCDPVITPLNQGLGGYVDVPFFPNQPFVASDFTNPNPTMSYTISPALPAGLTMNPSTGVITGTPQVTSENQTFTVTGTDTSSSNPVESATAVIGLQISAAHIGPPSQTVTGQVGAALTPTAVYSPVFFFGGLPTYSIAPALPSGLTFNSLNGVISGTPTVTWPTTTHTVTAADDTQSATATVTLTVNNPPPPPPPPNPEPPPAPIVAPSRPPAVIAQAGDRSAAVFWATPASSGGSPITAYVVTSSPGGRTCVSATTTCQVTGLTNGTPYTFTVKARNEAGWSSPSPPSKAVTPRTVQDPSITITGSRVGERVVITGTTVDLDRGARLRPWVKVAGQERFVEGEAVIRVDGRGRFDWERVTTRGMSVFILAPDGTRSNTVVIRKRA